MSTGIGYDCHRLVAGRRLVLGGVELEHELGLEGHSDADVLTHAIIDAMLGACALGDIGQHFPDTDPRYRGADSIELLRRHGGAAARRRLRGRARRRHRRDRAAQARPVRDRMRARLAGALGWSSAHVSVKATRGEGMGFVGREEGVAALAVATVRRSRGLTPTAGPRARLAAGLRRARRRRGPTAAPRPGRACARAPPAG